jgi:peptide chain release factor 1
MDRRNTAQATADASGAVITIQRGVGIEAATFAAELCRMYLGYATRRHWAAAIRRSTASDGGYQDVTIQIEGPEAYGRLRSETGTHRAQRIPVAAAGGRIHTCLVRVKVLPEMRQIALHRGAPQDDQDVKIRTYNFPQDRVSDHRIPVTLDTLSRVLEGDMDTLLDALENTDP